MSIKAIEEQIRVQSPFRADERSSADTRYNDQTTAASATGIDTRGYDEALVLLDLNTIAGAGTLDITVLDSSVSGTAAGAAAISGAAFSQKSNGDQGPYVGRVKTKLYNRYLYIKGVAAGATSKKYSVHVILGRSRDLPVSQVNAAEFTV